MIWQKLGNIILRLICPDWYSMFSAIALTSLREATGGPPPLALNQEETCLLCKMSPASHFFFFEKVEKNSDNKSVHSCCEETLPANFQSRFSFPVYFQELRQSKTERFSFEIAWHCMQSHAIAVTLHAIACNLCDIACNHMQSLWHCMQSHAI